jgi:hypothetical protein
MRVKPTEKYREYQTRIRQQDKFIEAMLNGETEVLPTIEYRYMFDGGRPGLLELHIVPADWVEEVLVACVSIQGYGDAPRTKHFNLRGTLLTLIEDMTKRLASWTADDDTKQLWRQELAQLEAVRDRYDANGRRIAA